MQITVPAHSIYSGPEIHWSKTSQFTNLIPTTIKLARSVRHKLGSKHKTNENLEQSNLLQHYSSSAVKVFPFLTVLKYYFSKIIRFFPSCNLNFLKKRKRLINRNSNN